MQRLVLIATGPTGGHFFPGLALAEILASRGVSVAFAVVRRPAIAEWLDAAGFERMWLPEARARGRAAWRFPGRFSRAWRECRAAFARRRPDALVATGSYVCVAPALAAARSGIPVVLHEQNVVPGAATRALAPVARTVCLTFDAPAGLPARRCVVTGFPVPAAFRRAADRAAVLRAMGLDPAARTVLVMGGSQGARFLNDMTTGALPAVARPGLQFIHLAGPDRPAVEAAYRAAGVPAAVHGFCRDMGSVYSAADAAVCRAGAGTVAETSLRGIPAILVPYPGAGNHQEANARYLADRGAAVLLRQGPSAAGAFPALFDRLLADAPRLRERLADASPADTGDRLADAVMRAVRP